MAACTTYVSRKKTRTSRVIISAMVQADRSLERTAMLDSRRPCPNHATHVLQGGGYCDLDNGQRKLEKKPVIWTFGHTG